VQFILQSAGNKFYLSAFHRMKFLTFRLPSVSQHIKQPINTSSVCPNMEQ